MCANFLVSFRGFYNADFPSRLNHSGVLCRCRSFYCRCYCHDSVSAAPRFHRDQLHARCHWKIVCVNVFWDDCGHICRKNDGLYRLYRYRGNQLGHDGSWGAYDGRPHILHHRHGDHYQNHCHKHFCCVDSNRLFFVDVVLRSHCEESKIREGVVEQEKPGESVSMRVNESMSVTESMRVCQWSRKQNSKLGFESGWSLTIWSMCLTAVIIGSV